MVGFALLAAGVLLAAFLLSLSLRDGARRRAGAELDAVATLRASAIAAWRAEHERNAHYAATYPVIETIMAAAARGPVPDALRQHGASVLGHVAQRHGYERIALLDPEGRAVVDWVRSGGEGSPFSSALLASVMDAGPGAATASAIVGREGWKRVFLDVADSARPAGARPWSLALRVEMAPFVASLLESWPVPSETASAMLVHAEAEEVVILSSPKRVASGLTLTTPGALGPGSPITAAARGDVGVRTATGPWGEPVIAAVRPVARSPWTVVTHMDVAEAEAPLLRPAVIILTLLAALLAVGAVLLARWWRDEQARAAMEEELRFGRDRLRLALAAAHSVWDWELRDGRIVVEAATDEGEATTEARQGSMEEVLAWFVHPEDLPGVRSALLAHVAGDVPLFEAEFRSAPGDAQRWLHARGRASERDGAGHATRVAGVFLDVTARRTLQAQLERSERLASLGTLAAGVAHELNNPLASILANLEYAQREYAKTFPPDLAQVVAETRDAAVRVRDVIRGLRAFSRPGSTRRVPSDVRAELDAAIRLARNELRHRARLEVEIGPLPLVVAGEHELGQVFLNLLVNAAQAIPEGRADENRVIVRARTDEAGWAYVEIRDTGAGMAPEVLQRIFEPFYTTKAKGTGTGLGLAIAHGIVGAAGGMLEVESQPGQGTVFRVMLPPAPLEPDEEPKAVAAAQAVVRRRVLVVDDDPLAASAAARALARDHEVVVDQSASDALARIDGGQRFDVILCDLMMPQMSGMDLHALLSEQHPEVARRMVFVTGGAFTEKGAEFFRNVPNTVLEKPYNLDQLCAALERVFAEDSALV
jgi:signal transduction histidine kinase/ActR/RegA family two-component response regulator